MKFKRQTVAIIRINTQVERLHFETSIRYEIEVCIYLLKLRADTLQKIIDVLWMYKLQGIDKSTKFQLSRIQYYDLSTENRTQKEPVKSTFKRSLNIPCQHNSDRRNPIIPKLKF